MEKLTYCDASQCDASLTDRKCDVMNDCPRLISESQSNMLSQDNCCSDISTPCQGTGYANCCSSFSDYPLTCSSGCSLAFPSSFPLASPSDFPPTSDSQTSICKTPPRCSATPKNVKGNIVCDGIVCRLIPCPDSEEETETIPILTLTPAMKNESQTTPCSRLPLNRMCSVPPRFTRYRHPSHKHRLFMLRGLERECDNANCKHDIEEDETVFTCFKCDFDLCQTCFQLDSETVVPLSKDDENIDDRTIETL